MKLSNIDSPLVFILENEFKFGNESIATKFEKWIVLFNYNWGFAYQITLTYSYIFYSNSLIIEITL
jgi:hypothetical protein